MFKWYCPFFHRVIKGGDIYSHIFKQNLRHKKLGPLVQFADLGLITEKKLYSREGSDANNIDGGICEEEGGGF